MSEILREIEKLNPKTSIQTTDVPTKIIKENKDIISYYFHQIFNNSLPSSTFPTALKKASVSPIFKKHRKTNIEKYRLISILPVLSKVYERLMHNQLYHM